MKRIFFLIAFAAFFIGLTSPFFIAVRQVKAVVNFCPQINIPGIKMFDTKTYPCTKDKDGNITGAFPIDTNSIALLAADAYKFIVGLAAIAAVIVLMAGGYTWLFAGGNASKVSEAKSLIGSAVLGLFLALGSYMILYLINPELTNLKSLDDITGIDKIKVAKITATSICSSGQRAEALKKDENFQCGSLYPPASDKKATSRCMDVYCPPESGNLSSRAICLLSSDGEGKFTAGNCRKSIEAEQYYPADKTIYTQYGAECGKVSSGTIYWYVDSYCSANDANTCALINQEGKYPDFNVTQSSATLNGFYKDKAINLGCRSDLKNAVK